MIWAIILAAGQSKRMGKPKLLLPFGEKTIIETVVEKAVRSKVDEVLVVLGSFREKIEQRLGSMPVKTLFNPQYSEGMHTSVQCGFREVPPETRAALVMLGDQPSVTSTTIDRVIEKFDDTKKGIILPVYQNRRGHPILIDLKYREKIKNLNPDIGLRELIHNHPEDISEIEVETSSILQDIDDVDDYTRELDG